MWWRVSVLSLLCVCLAACGFQPLYAQKSENGDPLVLAGVQVDPIPKREGQMLREELEDKLNPRGVVPPKPAYRLVATVATSEVGIDTSIDGTVSRYNVYIDSTYTLFRMSDNKKITSGSLRQVGSYSNITNEYFSTYVSEQDAIKRGIIEMAEIYRARLAAFLTEVDENHGEIPPPAVSPFVPPPKDTCYPENPNGVNVLPSSYTPALPPLPITPSSPLGIGGKT